LSSNSASVEGEEACCFQIKGHSYTWMFELRDVTALHHSHKPFQPLQSPDVFIRLSLFPLSTPSSFPFSPMWRVRYTRGHSKPTSNKWECAVKPSDTVPLLVNAHWLHFLCLASGDTPLTETCECFIRTAHIRTKMAMKL